MAVVGAKAKEAFGGPFRGQDYNGNNYTKHQIKCHEVSRTFQYLVLRDIGYYYNVESTVPNT